MRGGAVGDGQLQRWWEAPQYDGEPPSRILYLLGALPVDLRRPGASATSAACVWKEQEALASLQ